LLFSTIFIIVSTVFSEEVFPGLGAIPFSNEMGLPGGSPRFYNYRNSSGGNMLAVGFEAVSGTQKQIVTALSSDGKTWGPSVVVAQDTLATTDLANPNLYQLPSGRLVISFRHHTMVPGQPTIYRIETCYTDDMQHWSFLGTVDAYTSSPKVGIWEPYLFQIPGNPNLYCAYAKELSNGLQNIVARVSTNGGTTWGGEFIISSTANSRDGMPTVTVLPDNSLLAIFEGWWTPTRGKFTVNSRRSFDGGRTWTEPQIVHESPGAHNSGAPWATRIENGNVVVVFMTDEDYGGALNWPSFASIKALVGSVQSNTVNWGQLQTIVGPNSYWPSSYEWGEGHLLAVSYNAAYRIAPGT